VWFDGVRSGDFDVALEANCQKVVNPFADVGRWLPQEVYRESVHYLFLFLFALVLSSAAVCVHPFADLLPGHRAEFASPSSLSNVAYQRCLPFATSGIGLMSYGPSTLSHYSQTAAQVDKIQKGSKPADLPVEQPTKFEQASISRQPRHLG
jgi:hypothetical protein